MQHLENCLLRVARALNARSVVWTLGGSMLLVCHGLADFAHDLDLVVAAEAAGAVDAALSALGERQPPNPDARYATAHFLEYEIDGVGVDVLAGFAVRHAEGTYAYTPGAREIRTMTIGGADIPLAPLEDWYVLYRLMGREEKARLLAGHFAAQGADGAMVKKWLGEMIPQRIKDEISAWENG